MTDHRSVTGTVTDFKRFAVHDGDGIRTTVFLKGCPLKCVWCHNPEGIGRKPQLAFYREKCSGCGNCAEICPNGVHQLADGVHTLCRDACVTCSACTEVCYAEALHLYGRTMTAGDVIDKVLEDAVFYTDGGGMTLSGGEPTQQPEFVKALLVLAKEHEINTALDTCGFARREIYENLLPYVDTFLYDIKHITEEGHLRCTGVSNRQILENLRFLSDAGARIEIRMPLVPGYNDDEETLHGIGQFLSGIQITRMRLLPYHSYARSKYDALGMKDTLPCVPIPEKNHLRDCAALLRTYRVPVMEQD